VGPHSVTSAKKEILRDLTTPLYSAKEKLLAKIAAPALRKTKKSPQPMNCGQVPYQEGG
tara:strand:+ start:379 stop:555 length:177 start_codon:yes stop_codon:yes gene_type:complete